jgi:cyclic beta-1,2-glucan synthetase
MMTSAGSGYSRWEDIAVTRWREDSTCDPWGSYVYVRDPQSGEVWSAAHHPTGAEASYYEAAYSEDHAYFHRRDGALETTMEVVVSPEDDAEIRRVTIANTGTRARHIELTSYAEIVLAPQADDDAHTAFARLFVQTEWAPSPGALLATRRPRSAEERHVYAAHVAAVEGETLGSPQFETDRHRFLGRGRTPRDPVSITESRPLSNSAGAVLDPIFALRVRVRIAPGEKARVAFSTLVAPTREEALDLADKYRDPGTFDRTMTLAWTQAQVQLHHLGIAPDEALLFQRLANRVLYADPSLRASREVLERCEGGARSLWTHGISGDLPIVVARLEDVEHRDIARQLVRAQEYWRLKRLAVDLVLLIDKPSSYDNDLQSAIQSIVPGHPGPAADGRTSRAGGVFILRTDTLPARERDLLVAAARAVIVARRGTLGEQLVRTLGAPARPAPGPAAERRPALDEAPPQRPAARVLERARRVRRQRPRVRRRARRGAGHAGAVDQRRRQRAVRVPDLRVGIRLHVVGEQQGEQADAVVERPGLGRPGRGALRARSRERGSVDTDAASAARGRLVPRPPRSGIHALRALHARDRQRSRRVRAGRGSREDRAPASGEPGLPDALALHHRLRRVGARRDARGVGAAPRDPQGRSHGRALRAQSLEP